MRIRIDYMPNGKQYLFHSCGTDEVVYGGAKGGGKSCALVMEALAYALEHPGADIYLIRETYDNIETSLIKEFREKTPAAIYSYSESKHTAVINTAPPSYIYFRAVDSAEDAMGFQGRSIDFIGIDELTNYSKKTVQILLSCLRSAKGFPVRFCGTCNPGGIGHSWVFERYIESTDYGRHYAKDPKSGTTIAFIPAVVYDNTALMKNDPAYVKRLENLPSQEKRAFLYGDWNIFEGQYFNEFKRDIHVTEPFDIPSHWERFCSLDYGMDMTCCLWWAVDLNGKCYITRELHMPGLTLSRAALMILSLMPKNEPYPKYIAASPDLWFRRQETGESGFEIMTKAGLFGLIPANNNRIGGWRALREYLQERDDGFGKKSAKLMIFSSCRNLIHCLPLLQHDKRNPEDAALQPHHITHAPDALRYGILSRPLCFGEDENHDAFGFKCEKDNYTVTPEIVDSYIFFNG